MGHPDGAIKSLLDRVIGGWGRVLRDREVRDRGYLCHTTKPSLKLALVVIFGMWFTRCASL